MDGYYPGAIKPLFTILYCLILVDGYYLGAIKPLSTILYCLILVDVYHLGAIKPSVHYSIMAYFGGWVLPGCHQALCPLFYNGLFWWMGITRVPSSPLSTILYCLILVDGYHPGAIKPSVHYSILSYFSGSVLSGCHQALCPLFYNGLFWWMGITRVPSSPLSTILYCLILVDRYYPGAIKPSVHYSIMSYFGGWVLPGCHQALCPLFYNVLFWWMGITWVPLSPLSTILKCLILVDRYYPGAIKPSVHYSIMAYFGGWVLPGCHQALCPLFHNVLFWWMGITWVPSSPLSTIL